MECWIKFNERKPLLA